MPDEDIQQNPLTDVNVTPLDRLIIGAESGGKNVLNYRFDPTHTASGFGQITNSTWKDFAPDAGVDLEKYPTAISAPFEQQIAVMHAIQAKRGVAPWAKYNPVLANELTLRGYGTGLWEAPLGQDQNVAALPDSLKQPITNQLAAGPSQAPNIAINLPMSPTSSEPHTNPLALFSIIKAMMAGTHSFTPVDYDPWKVANAGKLS